MREISPHYMDAIPIPSSAFNDNLLKTIIMIYLHAFQHDGFDGCMHVVSIGVDPFSQLDLLSTFETDQLINPVPVDQPGSSGIG